MNDFDKEEIPLGVEDLKNELKNQLGDDFKRLPASEDWRGWIFWNEKRGLTDFLKNQKPLYDEGIRHLHKKRWERMHSKLPDKMPLDCKNAIAAVFTNLVEYFAQKHRNDPTGLPTGYLEKREQEIGELVGKAYQIGLKLDGTTRESFFSSFDLLNKSFVKMELPEFHDKTFVVSYVIESFFRKGVFPTRREVSERLVKWGENPNGKKHDLDKPLKNLGLKLRPEKPGPK